MNFNKIFQKTRVYFAIYKYPLFALIIILILILLIPKKRESKQTENKKIVPTLYDCDRSKYATAPITTERTLKDLNDIQNIHAMRNGLENIYLSNAAFIEDSARVAKEHILIKIKDNRYLIVKDLTHSFPYATPETVELLNVIGELFLQKLQEKKLGYYRFLVTSALRTTETQEHLLKRNRNASTQSAHLYGATIDITYKEFFNVKTGELEQSYLVGEALRETMLDLREQCRLLVVRERKQAVYHFTVVNCDPTRAPKDALLEKVLEY